MNAVRQLLADRNVAAWLSLVLAVAVHVADEAASGFLPFYNQLVLDLRGRLGFFLLPTFSFRAWLGGLMVAILIGLAALAAVARGGRLIRVVTTALGVLMVGNALGHLLGSLWTGRVLPGALSSPLLLAAAVFVVARGVAGDWRRPAGDRPEGGEA